MNPFLHSTPDRPVHCVEWGKQLFILLFGEAPKSRLFEEDASQSSFMREASPPTDFSIPHLEASARQAFDAIFRKEVQQKLDMTELYKVCFCRLLFEQRGILVHLLHLQTAKYKPTPISMDQVLITSPSYKSLTEATLPDEGVVGVEEYIKQFLNCYVYFWSSEELRTKHGNLEVSTFFVCPASCAAHERHWRFQPVRQR